MRKTVLVATVLAALSTPAHAVAGTCVSLADPAGDSGYVGGAVPLAPAPLDVLHVDLVASDTEATVTFTTAAAPVAGPGQSLFYQAGFEDSGAVYTLQANVAGTDFGAHPFVLAIDHKELPGASVTSARTVEVSGSVDVANHTVTVTAPASAFDTPLTSGRTWTATGFTTAHGIGRTTVGRIDNAYAALPLVAGDGTCA